MIRHCSCSTPALLHNILQCFQYFFCQFGVRFHFSLGVFFFFLSWFPALAVLAPAPCRQQGNGTSKSMCALFHLQIAPLMLLHGLFLLPFVSLPIHPLSSLLPAVESVPALIWREETILPTASAVPSQIRDRVSYSAVSGKGYIYFPPWYQR